MEETIKYTEETRTILSLTVFQLEVTTYKQLFQEI